MKLKVVSIIFVLTLFCPITLFGQKDNFVIEREAMLGNEISDTARARIYIDLAEYIIEEKDWMVYNKKALDLANHKLKTVKGDDRLYYIKIKANAVGNLGYYQDDHGNISKSIDYYFQSLKLYDEAKDNGGKAQILGNLGIIYTDRGDYDEALDYLNQALQIKLEYFPNEVAKNYINLGVAHERLGNSDLALEFYIKGYDAAILIDHKIDMSTAVNNIGAWHFAKHNYDKAKPYLKQAINLCIEEGDEAGAAWAMANIASCYQSTGQLDSSLFYLEKAELIAEQYQYPELTQTVSEKYSFHYQRTGDYKSALKYYILSVKMSDSLEDVDAQKTALRSKLNYDHELETTANRLKREEEKKREAQRFYFILGVLILSAFFALIIYSRLRVTKRQKRVIESQKQAVEEQKKVIEHKSEEITDSINYAKRLQEAILPPLELFENSFSDESLLYLPKDIVAGDFYWIHKTDASVYFAVADCTGHGVPGALVSVVCANALERSIIELPDASTNELLDRVTSYVIKSFEKEGTDVKDGMDIGLCRLNRSSNILQFTGAFNPCVIVRGNSLTELKGDRRPVGKHLIDSKFSVQEYQCEANDWIYLYSDGFHDQFGGDKGKKYKSKLFKELLIKVSTSNGDKQRELLEKELSDWIGELDQIDDVCVLGVKI